MTQLTVVLIVYLTLGRRYVGKALGRGSDKREHRLRGLGQGELVVLKHQLAALAYQLQAVGAR